jgi:hypothetical protein
MSSNVSKVIAKTAVSKSDISRADPISTYVRWEKKNRR